MDYSISYVQAMRAAMVITNDPGLNELRGMPAVKLSKVKSRIQEKFGDYDAQLHKLNSDIAELQERKKKGEDVQQDIEQLHSHVDELLASLETIEVPDEPIPYYVLKPYEPSLGALNALDFIIDLQQMS